MAKRKASTGTKTADYRHSGETRKNIPPAKIAGEGSVPKVERVRYAYNPHLPPILRFDSSGGADKLSDLLDASGRRPLSDDERTLLRGALSVHEPWLEWAGKSEQHKKGIFEVDPVALHIHERVSAQACVRSAMRQDIQKSLFADPEQPYREAVQFYRHDIEWANRLILGDSVHVMASLSRRENLAGKVQMIYMDPPYGISFKSNFQSHVGQRDVSDRDKDLTREAEAIQAYRDTWTLGVHSYLGYLRDRLVVCHELLADDGSLFVQINDQHLSVVRDLGEEIFGRRNFIVSILIKKKGSQKGELIDPVNDYVLWFVKNKELAARRYRQLYTKFTYQPEFFSTFRLVELANGETVSLVDLEERDACSYRTKPDLLKERRPGARIFTSENATSGGVRRNQSLVFEFEGRPFDPGLVKGNCWKHTATSQQGLSGMERLARAGRLYIGQNQLRLRRYATDAGVEALSNWWDGLGGAPDPVYVVQTNPEIVKRCMLMTTEPGDLVLDPTNGGGTTALVAEHWARRWIAIDTSRISIAAARQRLLTAQFPMYRLKDPESGPRAGVSYEQVTYVTSSVIANCTAIDLISTKHEGHLAGALATCDSALAAVTTGLRKVLAGKLAEKTKMAGKRAVTDADRRRWDLPARAFSHWTVPFDIDPDWPAELQTAVQNYRKAWRAKMDEVNSAIEANAEQKELVDQPVIVKGVVRVSGPFTVESVRPEELSLGEHGLFDATPDELEEDEVRDPRIANLNAYLTKMVQCLRSDGLTFVGNKYSRFARLEPLFASATGSVLHAEGAWGGGEIDGPATVAVTFGPQYGPVTALQVEDAIRAAKRYDELVVAGFSFDAEASAVIEEQSHPKLRIHATHIRPDVNPAMDGFLKETPGSQLFSVFGQPDIVVKKTNDEEWLVRLDGVCIYNPVTSEVQSTGASKVAAWFLDGDYDGRCFCITQAFFPDQDAWEKIAKALGGSADPEAFDAFKGTESLPFAAGKHKRIAVKVIDPRGNEVMAIRSLAD